MVVILGKGNDVALRGDLESAAAADLDIGALELANQGAVSLEHGNMEPISMAVTHQHVSSITDVDAIGVVGDVLTTNTAQELALFTEDHNAVTLQRINMTWVS